MNWLEIIGIVGGGGIIGTVTTLLLLKPKIRKETAGAEKVEVEATEMKRESDTKLLDWGADALERLNTQFQQNNRKVDGLQRMMTEMIAILRKQDIFHCSDISCIKRVPTLGEYKTELPKHLSSHVDPDKNEQNG